MFEKLNAVPAMLDPVIALVLWTFVMWGWMYATRIPAIINFTSGYVQRSIGTFPKQGSKTPWRLHQNYAKDLLTLRYGSLDDGALEFIPAPAGERAAAVP